MAALRNWFLCLVVVSLSHATVKTSGDNCSHKYIEQPPNDIQCNPYQMAELKLECTVHIPSSQLNREVVWFHKSSVPASDLHSETGTFLNTKLHNMQPNILIRQQQQTLSGSPQVTWVRSQLQISNLNDSYPIGAYYCSIQVDGVEETPSDSIYLEPSNAYSHLGACSRLFALSKAESKCLIPTMVPSPSTMTTQTVDVSTTHKLVHDLSGGSDTERGNQETENGISDQTKLILAISSAIIFGALLCILVPILLYLCYRKKAKAKVSKRHAKIDDLKRVGPAKPQQSASIMITLEASDYLVPHPNYPLQEQPEPRIQKLIEQSQNFYHGTYDRVSAYSHDYEDIEDSTTVVVSHTMDQLQMKKNSAYRSIKMLENGWKETTIPLPKETNCNTHISNKINYLRTNSHSNESMSDISDDLNITIMAKSDS